MVDNFIVCEAPLAMAIDKADVGTCDRDRQRRGLSAVDAGAVCELEAAPSYSWGVLVARVPSPPG
jgi:hypothetical protein